MESCVPNGVPPDVVLGFLNSVESSLSEGAGENPVEGAKLGGAGLEGFLFSAGFSVLTWSPAGLWALSSSWNPCSNTRWRGSVVKSLTGADMSVGRVDSSYSF